MITRSEVLIQIMYNKMNPSEKSDIVIIDSLIESAVRRGDDYIIIKDRFFSQPLHTATKILDYYRALDFQVQAEPNAVKIIWFWR